MSISIVDQIAKSVLYEGYLLYPYRASAVKNQHRWTFGGIYPKAYSLLNDETDPWLMQTECLLEGEPGASVTITMRFLHLIERTVGKLETSLKDWPTKEPKLEPVAFLQVGDQMHHPWEEAEEKNLTLEISLTDKEQSQTHHCSFEPTRQVEPIRDNEGIVGAFIRNQHAIDAQAILTLKPVKPNIQRLTVQICNVTEIEQVERCSRPQILRHSMASTHTILEGNGVKFFSMMDPAPELAEEIAQCQNIKTWPIMVGNEEDRHMMLSSPIILYDYPEIAPESPGDFFDGTEIDEMLTLRILTMTDEEKKEMANVDAHARALLERTESLGQEQLASLHGTIRNLQPWTPDESESESKLKQVQVDGILVQPGDRVRLHPQRRADVMDLALDGKTATIQTIEQNFEEEIYVTVTIDDDPGSDIGEAGKIGHRFFFGLEEIELLSNE